MLRGGLRGRRRRNPCLHRHKTPTNNNRRRKTGGRHITKKKKTASGLTYDRTVKTNSHTRPLSEHELRVSPKQLQIPHFRGVYTRNAMPNTLPWENESAHVNLEDESGLGIHWVFYKKRGIRVYYFDRYGNLRPPSN